MLSIALFLALQTAPPSSVDTNAAGDVDVHALRFGPGCIGSRWVNLNLAGAPFAPMSAKHGGYFIRAINIGALADDTRLLFPEAEHFSDPGLAPRFLADVKAAGDVDTTFKREVLDDNLPVLVGAIDFAFQYPYRGHPDYLALIEDDAKAHGSFADTVRKFGRLVRYTKPDGSSIMALELDRDGPSGAAPPAVTPLHSDVLDYDRRFAVLGDIKPKDGDDEVVHYYAFSRAAGNSVRMKKLLDDWRAKLPADRTLLLHGGNVHPDKADEGGVSMCADFLKGEHFDGAVPRENDLALGPQGLTAFAARAAVPFVAANLKDADGKRPFPRFRIVEQGGATIAIVGVVGSKRLASLPSSVRAQWKLDPVGLALDDAVNAIHDQLRRWPDVTYLISSAEDEPDFDAGSFGKIDVVVTSRDPTDLVERTDDIHVKDREHFRGQVPSLVAAMPGYTVSHVDVRLGAPIANGRRTLREVSHEAKAALDGDPQDLVFKKTFRAVEERDVARDAEIIVPDPEPFIRAHPELHALVWGERVAYRGGWTRIDPSWSPFVTDPLWMQLVTNAMKSQLHTEVALAVNLKRNDDLLGSLGRFVIEDWLSSSDTVFVAKLSGAELMQVAARIAKQDVEGAVHPRDFLFAAGLDAKRMRINGRSINPDETYLVAYSETVATLPELEGVLRDKPSAVDDKPQPIHDVVFRELDAHKNSDAIFDLFLDHKDVVVDRTTAGFDELSLSGNALTNSDNTPTYTGSRETRVSTPNLYQLGVHANAFFLYDGSWIANEWRLLAYLDGVYINIPTLHIAPNETRDDIVLSSELRVNKLKLGIGTDDFQAIPFVQVAGDSEFTPTPLPSPDPHKELQWHPHQYLVREEAGFVAYPGPIIRELRLGVVVQHDFSEVLDPKPDLGEATGLHNDAGFVVGYKLSIPIWRVRYDTSLDLRYFVPDADDRKPPTAADLKVHPELANAFVDLALRADWVHKLVVPISPTTAVYGFVDAFIVSTKDAQKPDYAWNAVLGVGLQFQQLFKF